MSESDSLELVSMYQNLDGPVWTNQDNWFSGPVSEWYGVTVSEDNCHVIGVIMISNGLVGPMPDLQFPELEELNLRGNVGLNAGLPDFTGMPSLSILDLSGTGLDGPIPDFQNLPELLDLHLEFNEYMSGPLPSFSATPSLRQLSLSHCGLTGQLLEYENLPNLQWLSLDGNALEGEIPDYTGLDQLVLLDLSFNELSGPIPQFALFELQTLNLHFNNLSGDIPVLDLPSLRDLELSYNQLTGSIPIMPTPELEWLRVQHNNLSGGIPDLSSNYTQLEYLVLNGNPLGGEIPDLSAYGQLFTFECEDCELVGQIPSLSSPSLRVVKLSNNSLTGPFPTLHETSSQILLANNQLSGPLPNFSETQVSQLSVCPNNFSGTIPTSDQFAYMAGFTWADIDFTCLDGIELSGHVFWDINGDCIFDADDIGLSGVQVENQDLGSIATTGENGFYEMLVGVGENNLSAILPNALWDFGCPELLPINIIGDSLDQSFENLNIALVPTEDCQSLSVEISAPLPRSCNIIPFFVDYCNQGTLAAEDAYIDLSIPELQFYSLEESHDELQDGTIRINLGTVPVGQCERIEMQIELSCDLPIGAAFCATAQAFPAGNCSNVSAVWDGSDISIDSECGGEEVTFTIINHGESMSSPNVYRCYEDDLLVNIGTYMLQAGESAVYKADANGKAHRVKAFCNEGNPFQDYAQKALELCGTEPYSLGFVNSSPYSDLSDTKDIFCAEIIGSFDPNDKSVSPTGTTDQNFTLPTTELEYRIRFQNTGNDTAFWVQLVDTLDNASLQLSTLDLRSSSHPYYFELIDNVAVWTFENILLPDSDTNEEASHGFVEFVLQQNEGNPDGTLIENFADIYFDNNVPIRTNTTVNFICSSFDIWDETALVSLNNVYLEESEIIEGESTFLNADFDLASFWIGFQDMEYSQEGNEIDVQFNFEVLEQTCWPGPGQGFESIVLENLSAGEYRINVGNNLNADTTKTEVMLLVSPPTDIETSSTIEGYSVYPNPFGGSVMISSPEHIWSSIEVRDPQGKVMHCEQLSGTKKIDSSKWPPGLYFFTIVQDQKIFTKRIIHN